MGLRGRFITSTFIPIPQYNHMENKETIQTSFETFERESITKIVKKVNSNLEVPICISIGGQN